MLLRLTVLIVRSRRVFAVTSFKASTFPTPFRSRMPNTGTLWAAPLPRVPFLLLSKKLLSISISPPRSSKPPEACTRIAVGPCPQDRIHCFQNSGVTEAPIALRSARLHRAESSISKSLMISGNHCVQGYVGSIDKSDLWSPGTCIHNRYSGSVYLRFLMQNICIRGRNDGSFVRNRRVVFSFLTMSWRDFRPITPY